VFAGIVDESRRYLNQPAHRQHDEECRRDFYISYACLICARNEKNNSVNCVAIQYINKILLKYEKGEAKYKSYIDVYQCIENV